MPLQNEPWNIDKHDRVAKIARSLSQDVGKAFKKKLKKLFPEKKVNGMDISKPCIEWTYAILTDFSNRKLQDELLDWIRFAYECGINLDTWKPWQIYMSTEGVLGFADKIDDFAQIAKLAFMDDLEKPASMRKNVKDVNW